MAFRVGQKVAQQTPWKMQNVYSDVEFTCCGRAYTIREIIEIDGISALRFVELRNPEKKYWNRGVLEQPFPAWNFRPVVECETDITIFTAMLNPSLEDVANLILQEVTLCP